MLLYCNWNCAMQFHFCAISRLFVFVQKADDERRLRKEDLPFAFVFHRLHLVGLGRGLVDEKQQNDGHLQVAMWQEYFGSNFYYYGVDINPACKKIAERYERTKIFIGDQGDAAFLTKVAQEVTATGPLHIILDDGDSVDFFFQYFCPVPRKSVPRKCL